MNGYDDGDFCIQLPFILVIASGNGDTEEFEGFAGHSDDEFVPETDDTEEFPVTGERCSGLITIGGDLYDKAGEILFSLGVGVLHFFGGDSGDTAAIFVSLGSCLGEGLVGLPVSFAWSAAFCICRHFARRFLNQTCKMTNKEKMKIFSEMS